MKRRMRSARAALATLRIPRKVAASGCVRPRFHCAERTTASNPARWEMSTSSRAAPKSCWPSESSTVAMVKTFPRLLCGPGGGGILEVVAGTGVVVTVGGGGGGGAAPVVERVVVPEPVPVAVEAALLLLEEGAAWELFPPPEDTSTAASAPPAASAATAAMAQAFLTRQEATLARE